MSQEARINALEHLMAALVLEAQANGTNIDKLLADVKSSLLGSNGPGGPEQKSAAVEALKGIEYIIG
jgi:carbamoylphosphate synthase small subunit